MRILKAVHHHNIGRTPAVKPVVKLCKVFVQQHKASAHISHSNTHQGILHGQAAAFLQAVVGYFAIAGKLFAQLQHKGRLAVAKVF